MKRKILATILAGIVMTNQLVTTVQAESVAGEGDEVDISVNVCIELTEEEAAAYSQSISEALESSIEELENEILLSDNDKKVDLLEEYKSALEECNVDDLFENNSDGTCTLEIPCENVELTVNGTEVETGMEGTVSVDADLVEADVADIESVDIEVENLKDDVEVEVSDSEQGIDCNIEMSFEEFAEGAVEMSENMESAEGQSVKQVFYPKRKREDTFGRGAGHTTVFFDTNIVGCNKCDTSETKMYSNVEFLLGNSDCAKSIKYGLLALSSSDIKIDSYYSMSIFCVQEAIGSINNEENNIYCNGKKKSGGHVNCSWFNGIGHSEAFHTHKYD